MVRLHVVQRLLARCAAPVLKAGWLAVGVRGRHSKLGNSCAVVLVQIGTWRRFDAAAGAWLGMLRRGPGWAPLLIVIRPDSQMGRRGRWERPSLLKWLERTQDRSRVLSRNLSSRRSCTHSLNEAASSGRGPPAASRYALHGVGWGGRWVGWTGWGRTVGWDVRWVRPKCMHACEQQVGTHIGRCRTDLAHAQRNQQNKPAHRKAMRKK